MTTVPLGGPGIGSLWRPSAPCGTHCRPGTVSRVGPWRQAARWLALLAALLFAAAVLPLGGRRSIGPLVTRLWARALLRAVGVRLTVRGRVPRTPALVVANHISWLDVVALLAVLPSARLVAKSEVRTWPVLGALAARTGTLFVDRSRPRSLPVTVAAVTGKLRAGGSVVCFPEGTTWCGPEGGRFRPALFQAALDAGVSIAPVALRYRSAGADTVQPAFVGDDTLFASVRRVVAEPQLAVTIRFAASLYPDAAGQRRVLARAAEAVVHD